MKTTSFTMKTVLLASLILTGKAMAQSLPDEINHPQYLKIYQNLEQVLETKTSEFEALSSEKAQIEKTISDMVRDQQAFPARNAELQRLIDSKKQELSRIQTEMLGLEGILSKIIEDLRRIDAMVAQLKNDIGAETQRSQAIQNARAQVMQDVARLDNALKQEMAEEQQSIGVLNNLNRDLNRDVTKRQELLQERQALVVDVERYKRDVVLHKNKVAANTQAVSVKRPQLTEAQTKLTSVKAQIATETSSLAQADAEIAPKKTKLAQLKADLAVQMPEVAKLQKEITDLNAKIESNKTKIAATGLEALKTKRDNLEKELASANAQIETLSAQIVAAKEAIKPDLGQLSEVRRQIRELDRSGANPTELARLRLEADAIEKRLAPKRQEIARMEKQLETLSLSVAPRNNELTNVKASIVTAEATVSTLTAENEAAKIKIAANQKIIDDTMAANSGLVKEINELEAAIKALDANRDAIAKRVTQLKAQESTLTTQIATLTKEIETLETESTQLAKTIVEMEKAITDFPLNIRRIDNHVSKLDEQIQVSKGQIMREEKLLARIQQDRLALQNQLGGAQNELNRVTTDLAQSNQLIGALQTKLQQESNNRDALTRYNQDSINKYDGLKSQKAAAEKVVADSNQEISVNNQDIATIAQELPRLRNDLTNITPRVTSAERAMSEAQRRADDASTQYQNRLSLFQKYLSDAQTLGSNRATLGTTDGVRVGAAEARSKASKLASDSAASEAKWVAMRRGYVRGEIEGYDNGFDLGLSSSADASLGDRDGLAAGAKRAKDQANMVLKPQFYLEEYDRRLVEDEVSMKKMNLAFNLVDQINTVASSSNKSMVKSDVPELTFEEIEASKRILSSLDSLIEQAFIEANQVVSLRSRLADARGIYTAPGLGENAQNANCSDVYKSVKEFVDACKTAYGARYQGLYAAAHQSSFIAEYGKAFSDQIIRTFDAELNRLYPSYLKEGSQVGKDVGLSAGKKEIYRQSFARSEANAYSANIKAEEARVEVEAVALVDEHLRNNAALTLKGEARLKGEATYGIAPGVEVELKMLIKNIGSKASLGNSLIKIKEGTNLNLITREAAIASVPAKSLTDLSVMKLKVSDSAIPGTNIVLSGEIIHPGNNYRASRVEQFRLETVIAVNPSIESATNLDLTPKVATLGIVRKHDIGVSVTPKFEGVEQGYEVSIEEVGSSYARFTNSKKTTERLNRGVQKDMSFEYKLEKSARGKTVNFKVTVKNGSAVIKTIDLQVKPQ